MGTKVELTELLDPDDRVQHAYDYVLPPVPESVRTAREHVLDLLDDHLPTLASPTRDDLLLLTSELVTNAVIHAQTQIELGLMIGERHVVVTVHDLDIGHVEVGGAAREGGWGLGLVRNLSDRSAMTRHPEGGKTAWFRLPL